MTTAMRTHRPPATCPVCADSLITLRLGCPSCATELSGHFEMCRYCRLDPADLAILEVFLRSRGNIREVQSHLEVSYPTARARLTDVLGRLGLGDDVPPPSASPGPGGPTGTTVADVSSTADQATVGAVLADLAAGRIDVLEAEELLSS